MAQINLRVDDELKRGAERTLNEIGLSMSTAISIFLKTVVRENRIPFELSADPFYRNIEDEYDIAIGEEAYKEYQKNPKRISHEKAWEEILE